MLGQCLVIFIKTHTCKQSLLILMALIWGVCVEWLALLGMVSVCQPNWGMSPLHASLSLPLFPLST